MATSFVIALTLSTIAQSAPLITLPINSQVPPVARIGSPFNFTFSPSTFASTTGQIRYELQNAPSWLSLDADRRTFSGVPQQQNAGPVQFSVKATDSTGYAIMSTTLYVSSDSSPQAGRILPAPGGTTALRSSFNSFVTSPSRPFAITFAPETFAGGKNMQFYATSADNTPLPSWIAFDPPTLKFSGVTPSWSSLVSPPQNFGLRLIASDVPGFAGTIINFNLIVGTHTLVFKAFNKTTNASKNVAFTFTGLRQDLTLDDQPIKESDIAQVSVQGPDWLRVDKPSLALSGTPPSTASSTSANVGVVDTNGNFASCTVAINIKSNLFNGTLSDVNATAGQSFKYQILSSIIAGQDSDVSASIDPPSSWLRFDPTKKEFTGDVPKDSPSSDIKVAVTIKSKSSDSSESQTFVIRAQGSPTTTSTDSIAPTSSKESITTTSSKNNAASSASSAPQAPPQSQLSSRTKSALLAVVIPLSLLVIAVAITLIYCHRRRKAVSRPNSPVQKAISKPLPDGSSPDSDGAYRAPYGAPVMGLWNSSRSLQHRRNARDESELDEEEAIQSPPLDQFSDSPRELPGTFPGTKNFSKRIPPARPPRPNDPSSQHATLRLVSSGTMSQSSVSRPVSGMGHGSGRLSTQAPSSFASFDYPQARQNNPSQAFTTDSWQTEDTKELETNTINRPSLVSGRGKVSISSIRSPPPSRHSSSRILRSAIMNSVTNRGDSPFFHSSQHSPTRMSRSATTPQSATDPRLSEVLTTWSAIAATSPTPSANNSSNFASAGSPPASPTLVRAPASISTKDSPIRHLHRRSALDAVIETFTSRTHRRTNARSSKSTITSQFRDAASSNSSSKQASPNPAHSPQRKRDRKRDTIDGDPSAATKAGGGTKRSTFGTGSPHSPQHGIFRLHRASSSAATRSTIASLGTNISFGAAGGNDDDTFLRYYAGDQAVVGTAVTAQTLTPQLRVGGRASGTTVTSAVSGESGDGGGGRLWGGGVRDVQRVSVREATTEGGRMPVSPSLDVERGAFI